MIFKKTIKFLSIFLIASSLSSKINAAEECFERASRSIFKFNMLIDDVILEPIAKGYSKLPVCVGFGIKTPEDAKAISLSADGVVVGSAIIETIQRGASELEVSDFISDLSKSVKLN